MKRILLTVLLLLIISIQALAADLVWMASATIAPTGWSKGYYVYVDGIQTDVGDVVTYNLDGLLIGVHEFEVSCYFTDGTTILESEKTYKIVYQVKAQPPTEPHIVP